MKKICLVNKNCVPCQGGILPLSQQIASKLIAELGNNWQINELGHLYKKYQFSDFMEPIKFANNIAEIAEREHHHPDLVITWGMCIVEIWTHKINGLTESDFILAAKIDAIK